MDPSPSAPTKPTNLTKRGTVLMLALAFVAGVAATSLVTTFRPNLTPGASAGRVPGVETYDLDIRGADIDMGGGAVWHAWTFNGTVPGPLLTVTAGDTLKVHVTNHLKLMHSFHTHLAPYGLDTDGSQVNIIAGTGMGAMIPPGGEYTYLFQPSQPGVYYYHCHSADGGHPILDHIRQGLYGVILVKAPDEAPVRDEAVMMGERGFDVTGDNAPFFIMNGKGIPGGEHTLEKLYADKGLAGVTEQFGKTVPEIHGKVGEPVRISIVNIGDLAHSFHLHGMNLYSVDALAGRQWPANVVPVLPGAADRVLVTPTESGVWLFHCHVVSHADGGMIGVMVVDPAK